MEGKMDGFIELPKDIVEQIMTCSPDFPTLFSLVSLSKSIYQVFQTHPKAILRCVAYNVIGPALPQALLNIRSSRYKIPDRDSEDMIRQQSQNDDIVASPIAFKEIYVLVVYGRSVAEFEDIFSNRYVDRTCVTSSLSSQESWIFRRALYRIMLYTRIFNASHYDLVDIDGDRITDPVSPVKVQEERLRRESFLAEFETDELLQIHSVCVFLMDLCVGAIPGFFEENPYTNLALAAGPGVILGCYHEQDNDFLRDVISVTAYEYEEDHPMLSEYISYPLLQVLESRKAKPPPSDLSHWHSISTRIGNSELCDQCNQTIGFGVWHEVEKREFEKPQPLWQDAWVHPEVYLKGNLQHNSYERAYMDSLVSSPGRFETMMNDIYDLDLKQDGFSDWTKEDVICRKCFEKFLREHLYVWLRHKKSTAGILKEDCWYGVDCRTQGHNPLHAQKLNHLCPKSR